MSKKKASSDLTPGGVIATILMVIVYYVWKDPAIIIIFVVPLALITILWYAFQPRKDAISGSATDIGGQVVRSFYTKIVGVSHKNPDGSSRQKIIARCSVGERLRLVREPDNPHDSQAIAVVRESGEQLGYISSDVAFRLADEIDNGKRFAARISDITCGGDRSVRGVNILIDVLADN